MRVTELPIDELGQVGNLAEGFFREANLVGGFSLVAFTATWTFLISSGSGIILAMKDEDGLYGALGAIKYNDPNDGEIVCSEAFWYVDKDKRGNGISLLKEFENWAKDNGAKRITMVHLVDSMPEKIGSLYERMGYLKKEVHYIKKL